MHCVITNILKPGKYVFPAMEKLNHFCSTKKPFTDMHFSIIQGLELPLGGPLPFAERSRMQNIFSHFS